MKKILITIIILLTITSAVLAYYNIQLKNENEKLKENQNIPANPDNNQNNDTCPIENEETISVDSAIIKNLLKTFSTKDCENHNLAKQFYSPQIITASKLDEKLLMFFVLRYYDDMIPKCTNSDVVTLEEESIKEAVGILFGTSIDFDKLDIKKNMTIQNYQIQYDKNTNNYTISNNNCDGCGPGIQPQILSNITYADKVGEIIHIYEQIAYLVYDDVNENNQVIYNTYKDLDKKEKVETITGEEIKDWSSYYTYKYTFQLENGYYVFKSIELVKNKDN